MGAISKHDLPSGWMNLKSGYPSGSRAFPLFTRAAPKLIHQVQNPFINTPPSQGLLQVLPTTMTRGPMEQLNLVQPTILLLLPKLTHGPQPPLSIRMLGGWPMAITGSRLTEVGVGPEVVPHFTGFGVGPEVVLHFTRFGGGPEVVLHSARGLLVCRACPWTCVCSFVCLTFFGVSGRPVAVHGFRLRHPLKHAMWTCPGHALPPELFALTHRHVQTSLLMTHNVTGGPLHVIDSTTSKFRSIEGRGSSQLPLTSHMSSNTRLLQARKMHAACEKLTRALNAPLLSYHFATAGIMQTYSTASYNGRVGLLLVSVPIDVVPSPGSTTPGPFEMHMRSSIPSFTRNHQARQVLSPGFPLLLLEVLELLLATLIKILEGTKGPTFSAQPHMHGPLTPDNFQHLAQTSWRSYVMLIVQTGSKGTQPFFFSCGAQDRVGSTGHFKEKQTPTLFKGSVQTLSVLLGGTREKMDLFVTQNPLLPRWLWRPGRR